jgi:hypothetical protein
MCQPRIVISARRTTYRGLLQQIEEHGTEPVVVVGTGVKAARFTDRLLRDLPNVLRILPGFNPREHAVMVNPLSDEVLAMRNEPGKPPVVWVKRDDMEGGAGVSTQQVYRGDSARGVETVSVQRVVR